MNIFRPVTHPFFPSPCPHLVLIPPGVPIRENVCEGKRPVHFSFDCIPPRGDPSGSDTNLVLHTQSGFTERWTVLKDKDYTVVLLLPDPSLDEGDPTTYCLQYIRIFLNFGEFYLGVIVYIKQLFSEGARSGEGSEPEFFPWRYFAFTCVWR